MLLAAVEKRELVDKYGARTIYLKPSVRSGGTRLLASVYVCALFATSKNYCTTTISTVVVSTCLSPVPRVLHRR